MSDRVQKMIVAIKQEAAERANEIAEITKQNYKIEKYQIYQAGREKINLEYKQKLDNYVIQKRIQNSAKINQARLRKMTERYEIIQKVKDSVSKEFEKIVKQEDQYKVLVQKLIIQGLIKLMEPIVELKCCKKDVKIVKAVLEQSIEQFTEIIKKETGKDFGCEIFINDNAFLDEIEKDSIGGVILSGQRGRIVCNNTIKNRIQLSFQQCLPEIRETLFPSMTHTQ